MTNPSRHPDSHEGTPDLSTLRLDRPAGPPHRLSQVPGYEIREQLGSGGMGIVYKAHQTRLNRPVALKLILTGTHAGPEERARFRAEAEAVSRLQHPNIVQIYEVGEHDGCSYLALEYVAGTSLAQQRAGFPLAPRQAAQLVRTLARAVHHAHQRGIVHRDLKPANVLQTPEGTLKITDFGLAKLLDADTSQTRTGTVMGSPSYMAPEQAEGKNRSVGPAADIYALGAILYELLTGRPPFQGTTVLETLEQVRTHEPVPPRALQPRVPRDLQAVCLKCLEKVAADRYASAEELALDLEAFLNGESVSAANLSLLTRLGRTISHRQENAGLRVWARLALVLTPFPLLGHLLAVGLCWGRPSYPYIAVAVSTLTVLSVMGFALWRQAATEQQGSTIQRRHLWSVRGAHLAGFLLMLVVVGRQTPVDRPAGLFLLYPLWTILVGTMFFALGSSAGSFYLLGAAAFAVAVVMSLLPSWAPLILGAVMSANMAVQGLVLRHSGTEAGPEPPGP